MATKASTRDKVWLYLSTAMLLLLAGSVSAISILDPSGWPLRVGMVLITVGGSLWLPARIVLVAAPFVWLGPNYFRFHAEDAGFLQTEGLLEIPGLVAIVLFGVLMRRQLRRREGHISDTERSGLRQWQLDEKTGVYVEDLFRESVEQELARSRRFGREFAVMLAAIDPLRVRFDYRDRGKWTAGLKATAAILLDTRRHIDRVFRYGERGFALLLPETGPAQIGGLLRRLTNTAKNASPSEGEPGGPLPLHFGVTFFPQCATTVDDILRRAEVALRLAEGNPMRIQIDGAEAPEMGAPELSRRHDDKKTAGREPRARAPDQVRQRSARNGPETAGRATVRGQEPPPPAHNTGRVPAGQAKPEEVIANMSAAQVRQPGESVGGSATRLAAAAQPSALDAGSPEPPPAPEAQPTEQRAVKAPPPVDPEIELAVSGLLERLGQTAELLRSLREGERLG